MSSTPVPVSPAPSIPVETTTANSPVPKPAKTDDLQNIEKDVEKVFSFGASHLVLIILLGISLLGAFYLFDSRRTQAADQRAAIAQLKEQQAESTAASADKNNQTLQAQVNQQMAALNARSMQLQQEVASLTQAIATRDSTLKAQTTQIVTLAPPALATQWGAAATEPAPSIDASGNFLVPLSLAQKSMSALITIPVLTQDKADLQSQVDNQKQIISNDANTLALERQAHQSDNATCTVDKTALGAQIDNLKAQNAKTKADARKSKFKWFGAGYVAGFITGIFVK